MSNHKLGASEKLKSRDLIKQVLTQRNYVYEKILKAAFITIPSAECHQVGFSVPKRNFKRAIDRNRIKRLMREAYRHHKDLLAYRDKAYYAIMFIYTSQSMPTHYVDIEETIKYILNKINHKNEKN